MVERNDGMRGEISIKGISGGKKLGFGPGAEKDGDFPADIDIRYSMGQGESGIYTYCIFEHLPEYPAQSMSEARYCAALTKIFDWITVDAVVIDFKAVAFWPVQVCAIWSFARRKCAEIDRVGKAIRIGHASDLDPKEPGLASLVPRRILHIGRAVFGVRAVKP